METQTRQMKPEIQRAITFVDGNRQYLQEQGIFKGSQTLKGQLEKFYDLEYRTKTKGVSPAGFGVAAFYTDRVLGLGKEDKAKHGKTPRELLDVLYTIHSNERELSNSLIYEQVRESFPKSKFPHRKSTPNMFLGLSGLAGMLVGWVYSMDCITNNQDPSTLFWSIPLAVGSLATAVYMPIKNQEQMERFNQEYKSSHLGQLKTLFQDYHLAAQTADGYVTKYKELFGEK